MVSRENQTPKIPEAAPKPQVQQATGPQELRKFLQATDLRPILASSLNAMKNKPLSSSCKTSISSTSTAGATKSDTINTTAMPSQRTNTTIAAPATSSEPHCGPFHVFRTAAAPVPNTSLFNDFTTKTFTTPTSSAFGPSSFHFPTTLDNPPAPTVSASNLPCFGTSTCAFAPSSTPDAKAAIAALRAMPSERVVSIFQSAYPRTADEIFRRALAAAPSYPPPPYFMREFLPVESPLAYAQFRYSRAQSHIRYFTKALRLMPCGEIDSILTIALYSFENELDETKVPALLLEVITRAIVALQAQSKPLATQLQMAGEMLAMSTAELEAMCPVLQRGATDAFTRICVAQGMARMVHDAPTAVTEAANEAMEASATALLTMPRTLDGALACLAAKEDYYTTNSEVEANDRQISDLKELWHELRGEYVLTKDQVPSGSG